MIVHAVRDAGLRVGAALRDAQMGGLEVELSVGGGEGTGAEGFRAAYLRARTGDVVVLIGACGIAVRFLDGLLKDKRTDPAVLVMDEAARHCVVLSGGHEGGGNAMAYRVAEVTGSVPVVTTPALMNRPGYPSDSTRIVHSGRTTTLGVTKTPVMATTL